MEDMQANKKKKSKRRRPPPPGISENDAKVLTKVKRRSYYLDMSLGICCCGLGIGYVDYFFILTRNLDSNCMQMERRYWNNSRVCVIFTFIFNIRHKFFYCVVYTKEANYRYSTRIGDIIAAYLSYSVVQSASKIDGGLPTPLYSKMIGNVMIDFAFGLVPIVGDIVNVVYKANSRNSLLLEKHLREVGQKNLKVSEQLN